LPVETRLAASPSAPLVTGDGAIPSLQNKIYFTVTATLAAVLPDWFVVSIFPVEGTPGTPLPRDGFTFIMS
jgi:hypothetical protein